MIKRIVQLGLIIVLLAAGTLSTVAAKPQPPPLEEIPIFPTRMNVVYKIRHNQVGVVQSGWGACTEGLVNEFIKASNFELELLAEDGSLYLVLTPDDFDELWSPIQSLGYTTEWCRGEQKTSFASWRVPLNDLPAGVYKLHFAGWIDHPLQDGGDYDGDGTPDVVRPEDYGGETVNTIIVK